LFSSLSGRYGTTPLPASLVDDDFIDIGENFFDGFDVDALFGYILVFQIGLKDLVKRDASPSHD
jgi:hypothetical protein